jgi:hypothetical protein
MRASERARGRRGAREGGRRSGSLRVLIGEPGGRAGCVGEERLLVPTTAPLEGLDFLWGARLLAGNPTLTQAPSHAHDHTHTHARTHARTHNRTHNRTQSHARTHTHVHGRTDAAAHGRRQTGPETRTRACVQARPSPVCPFGRWTAPPPPPLRLHSTRDSLHCCCAAPHRHVHFAAMACRVPQLPRPLERAAAAPEGSPHRAGLT